MAAAVRHRPTILVRRQTSAPFRVRYLQERSNSSRFVRKVTSPLVFSHHVIKCGATLVYENDNAVNGNCC